MLRKIVLTTASTLVLSACIPGIQTSPTPEPQSQTNGDSYSQVAQVLQQGGSATCTITKKDGSSTIDYAISGQKVRVTGIVDGNNQYSSMISDGDMLYTWSDTTKKGIKFVAPNLETATQTQGQVPSVPDLSNEASRAQYVQEGYDVACQVATVPETLFVPPTDVTFTDMTELMQNAQQMQLPLNQNPGQAPTPDQQQQMQEQAQQMMEQFGQ